MINNLWLHPGLILLAGALVLPLVRGGFTVSVCCWCRYWPLVRSW